MADNSDSVIQGALNGQQFQLNQFLLQEAPIKLEQEKMALTIQKQDFGKRQQLADMLAAKPPPEGQNPLETAQNALMTIGADAAKSGLIEESAKAFQSAATLSIQQEDAAYKNYQAAMGRAKFSEQILANVTDQKSWDQANAYIEMTTGKPSAMASKKWSPELVQTLREATTKHLDDATEAWKKAQTRKENVETSLAPLKAEALLAEKEAAVIRAANAKKAGGDGLMAPPRIVNSVTKALIKDSNDMMPTADANTVSEKISLDVQERMLTKRQTLSEATHDAIVHWKKTGGDAGLPRAHVPAGTDWSKPAPLPKTPEEWKDKTIYNTPKGPMWYDAKKQTFYPRNTGPEGQDIPDESEEDDE